MDGCFLEIFQQYINWFQKVNRRTPLLIDFILKQKERKALGFY